MPYVVALVVVLVLGYLLVLWIWENIWLVVGVIVGIIALVVAAYQGYEYYQEEQRRKAQEKEEAEAQRLLAIEAERKRREEEELQALIRAQEERKKKEMEAKEAAEEQARKQEIVFLKTEHQQLQSGVQQVREKNQHLKAEIRKIECFVTDLNIFDAGFLSDYPQLLEYIDEVAETGRLTAGNTAISPPPQTQTVEPSSQVTYSTAANDIPRLSIDLNSSTKPELPYERTGALTAGNYDHEKASRLRAQRRKSQQKRR